ncbi:hypothetical protein NECAME_16702 [Necator americanus]|uniref:Late embryogeneis abundant protein n=1 Tax=Necator americanus TaxID=51031 RepID=W2TVG4_NECAM|nr:hypothetical protein NECAME_16702 [Necator americanus]ETN85649.1 hypothetical protein NECAME_16702 [Necator americanus]
MNNAGFFANAGNKAQEVADSAKEKIVDAGKTVKDAVGSGFDKVTHAGSDAGHSVKNTVEAGYDKVVKTGNETGQAVKGKANSAYEQAEQAGKDTLASAEKKWDEGKNCAARKADEACNFVGNQMHKGGNALQRH